MRFIVFFVFLGSWSAMWWWTYVFHVKDCTSLVRGYDGTQLSMADAKYPIGFIWGEGSPVVDNDFSEWVDSVAGTIREDQILVVIGLAYRDEVTGIDVEYLARARARAVARLFDAHLPRTRLTFEGRIGEVSSDIRNKVFVGFELHKYTRNSMVIESEYCTFLHYPYDSLSGGRAHEVGQYLNELALELKKAQSSVEITPVIAMAGAKEDARHLLEWRLNNLRDTLIAKTDSLARLRVSSTFRPISDFCDSHVRELDQSWFVVKKN